MSTEALPSISSDAESKSANESGADVSGALAPEPLTQESIKSANESGTDVSGALAGEPLTQDSESIKNANVNGAHDASDEIAAEPRKNLRKKPRTIAEPRRNFVQKHHRTIVITLLSCAIILAVLFGFTIFGVIAFLALNK